MPPVALTCLKYASEPQLSLSPICAYTPESASSLQTTMVELALAELPPPPPPHAASAPASKALAAAAATLNVVRLRIIVLSLLRIAMDDKAFQLPTSSELTTGEDRKSAGPPLKTRWPPDSTKIRSLTWATSARSCSTSSTQVRSALVGSGGASRCRCSSERPDAGS